MFGGGQQRRGGGGLGTGFGEGPMIKKNVMSDGPVSIPRWDRIQLRNCNNHTNAHVPTTISLKDKQLSAPTTTPSQEFQTAEVQSPPTMEAANHPTWSGQTLEYATGKSLRQQVLEPLLTETFTDDIPEEEASRLLSYFAKGQIILLEKKCEDNDDTDKVAISSMERVVQADGPTLLEAWWREGDLVLSHTNPEWSDWWVQRCNLFDSGCEMLKLQEKKNGVVLGVAYFERNTNCIFSNSTNGIIGVENQASVQEKRNEKNLATSNRITLIRGIRVKPKYNCSILKRLDATSKEVEYPGILSALFHAILLQSLRYGTNGVGVSSPKSEMMESFYKTFMGSSSYRDPNDGRQWFQINSQQRFQLIQNAFREQLQLLQQVFHKTQDDSDNSDAAKSPPVEVTEGKGNMVVEKRLNTTANTEKDEEKRKSSPAISEEDKEKLQPQQKEETDTVTSITSLQERESDASATAGQATQEAGKCPAIEQDLSDDNEKDKESESTLDSDSNIDNKKRSWREENANDENSDDHHSTSNKKKQKLGDEEN